MKEKIAIKELISFYSKYVNSNLNDSLKKKAILIETKFLNPPKFWSKEVLEANQKLNSFYSYSKKPISKEIAKKLIEKLNKRKKEIRRILK